MIQGLMFVEEIYSGGNNQNLSISWSWLDTSSHFGHTFSKSVLHFFISFSIQGKLNTFFCFESHMVRLAGKKPRNRTIPKTRKWVQNIYLTKNKYMFFQKNFFKSRKDHIQTQETDKQTKNRQRLKLI